MNDYNVDFSKPVMLPEFKPEWLGSFAEYTKAVAESFQVAPELPAVLILGAVSVATLGKYVVHITNEWNEPTQLYICAVAGSSEKKSPTLKRIFRPIEEYESKVNQNQRKQIAVAKMKLAALKKAEDKATKAGDFSEMERIAEERFELEKQAHEYTLCVDDATSEVVPVCMNNNDGCISCVSAEGGIFSNMAGRYANGIPNLDIFLKGYSNEVAKIHRVGREPIILPRACMSMVMCVQPDVINGILENSAMSTRGLVARFLWCFPKEKAGYRSIRTPDIPEDLESAYSKRIHSLLTMPRPEEPHVMRMTSGAAKLFEESREQTEKHMLDTLSGELKNSGWSGKHDGRIARIAATLAMIDGSEEIERCHVVCAIEIGQWAIEHARFMLDSMGDSPESKARHYLEIIRTKFGSSFTLREMQRSAPKSHGKTAKVADVRTVLGLLEDEGFIEHFETDSDERLNGTERFRVRKYN